MKRPANTNKTHEHLRTDDLARAHGGGAFLDSLKAMIQSWPGDPATSPGEDRTASLGGHAEREAAQHANSWNNPFPPE